MKKQQQAALSLFTLFPPPFAILLPLLVAAICWPVGPSNAEQSIEQKFNDMLRLVQAKYVSEGDVKTGTVELPFARVAQLLMDIEGRFVNKLAENCAEEKPVDDWQKVFLSLSDNFRALNDDHTGTATANTNHHTRTVAARTSQEAQSLLLPPEMDLDPVKEEAKANAQLVQLLLSFNAQLGYTVGARAFKNGQLGVKGRLGAERLGRFLQVYNCLDEKIESLQWRASRPYTSATFVANEEKKILYIKFDPSDSDVPGEENKQREYNFKLLCMLNKEWNEVGSLSAMVKPIVEKQRLQQNTFSSDSQTKTAQLLMAWAGINDSSTQWRSNYGNNGKLLFLQKRFGHGLAQRLVESQELAAGYFRLYPQEKVELESNLKKLELSDVNFKALAGNGRRQATFHYEDAININTTLESYVNFYIFNKQIRPFLAHYVEDEETKSSLKKEQQPTAQQQLSVEMPISSAAHFLRDIGTHIVTPSMMEKCRRGQMQQDGGHLHTTTALLRFADISRDLAKFQDNNRFQMLLNGNGITELQQLNASRAAVGKKQLAVKGEEGAIQVLKLLLSFAIQLGYTVGSTALGLLERQQLNHLLELHSCLEMVERNEQSVLKKLLVGILGQIGDNSQLQSIVATTKNSVYPAAQFEYAEEEKDLTIKFEAGSDYEDSMRTRNNFLLLKTVSEQAAVERSVADIIDLLEYLNEMRQKEAIVKIYEHMTTLMRAWSGGNRFSLNGKPALCLLKRYGRDLGQRLFDEKLLNQDDFSKVFPSKAEQLTELLANLSKDAQECHQTLNDKDKKHLQYLPHLHFEEVIPVKKFGLKEVHENVTEAVEMVNQWAMGMKAVVEQVRYRIRCGRVLSSMFKSKHNFDRHAYLNLVHFDADIDSALNVLKQPAVVQQIVDKENWFGSVDMIKTKFEMGRGTLELEEAEKELEGKLNNCLEVQMPPLVKQVKVLQEALEKLEAKVQRQTLSHSAKVAVHHGDADKEAAAISNSGGNGNDDLL